MARRESLVWIDLEMTGLNAEFDVILEIATIITDNSLNIIAQGPSFIIHQPDAALALMDPVVRSMHTKSGLLDNVQKSNVTIYEATEETLAFIQQHVAPKSGVLAGNSVWQDRTFLVKYMPQITNYLHYRIIDVSTVKELVQNWYPNNSQIKFKKPDNHRAMEDIDASIKELAHYRKHFFLP